MFTTVTSSGKLWAMGRPLPADLRVGFVFHSCLILDFSCPTVQDFLCCIFSTENKLGGLLIPVEDTASMISTKERHISDYSRASMSTVPSSIRNVFEHREFTRVQCVLKWFQCGWNNELCSQTDFHYRVMSVFSALPQRLWTLCIHFLLRRDFFSRFLNLLIFCTVDDKIPKFSVSLHRGTLF